jgi:hypothetical protein
MSTKAPTPFNITLGKAVDAATTITFKLGGDIESDDIGTPVVTIGGTTVTLVNNGDGTYSFQVRPAPPAASWSPFRPPTTPSSKAARS